MPEESDIGVLREDGITSRGNQREGCWRMPRLRKIESSNVGYRAIGITWQRGISGINAMRGRSQMIIVCGGIREERIEEDVKVPV